jgi:Xaa-Pro aminopeptidase
MMSNEEWERKMDFLLNQQARFDAEMYELKAAQARTDQRFAQTEEQIGNLAGLIHEGFGLVLSLFKKTDAEIKELKESQKLTDEALRKFIARFDRHLSEGHPELEN